jgi:hypothetical protein
MATKTYQLYKSELVSNSPYTVEGTDVVLDVPPQRNVPWKFVVTISDHEGNHTEREVRYIRGAQSIYVDEQIKAGIKADRKPTPQEMLDLTFVHGRLEATRPNQIEYLDTLPLNDEGKSVKQQNQRIMYTSYDPVKVKKAQRSDADKQVRAYSILSQLNYEQMQDALRFRGIKAQMDEDDCFLALKNIIEAAKDGVQYMNEFGDKLDAVAIVEGKQPSVSYNDAVAIVEGKQSVGMTENDRITSMVYKLIEADQLSLTAIPNSVALISKEGKYKVLAKLEDSGDMASKTERFIDLVGGDPAIKKILTARVDELEKNK